MFDRKILKTRAKTVLSRSFFTAFIACFIVSLASGGGVGISTKKLQSIDFAAMSQIRIMAVFATIAALAVIALLFWIMLTAPLKVGLKKFMICASEGDIRLDNMLFPFKNSYKNVTIALLIKNLFIFLWALLGLIPIGVGIWKFGLLERLDTLSAQVAQNSVPAAISLMMLISALLTLSLIFTVPAIIKELQYALTEYILADDPTANWRTAIGRSKEMMHGNKWGLVKLIFSFSGWYIAATLFCCIGNFILMPYIEATLAEMYLDICGRGRDNNVSFNSFGF